MSGSRSWTEAPEICRCGPIGIGPGEGGLTPLQLYVTGLHELHREGKIAEDFLKTVEESYGIDPNGPIPIPDVQEAITVPKIVIPLSNAMKDELETIDPLGSSSDSGVDLYERVLQVITR